MSTMLIEKLQRKSKEYGIYLIRRLDCNLKGQPHSYCVSFKKRTDWSFADSVKRFDNFLRAYIPDGSRIKYMDRMFVVYADNSIYYFCLEAYKKSADSRGYMEDGTPQTEFLHRMGVEQAVRRIKKYSHKYWLKHHDWFSPEKAIEEIKQKMSDPDFVEWYPNHADRFIAGYNALKDQMKWKSDYIKGVL